jgi:hypothetical protein
MRISPVGIHAEHIVDARANAEARMDRVSQESADSFPASDPPSWTPLHVGSPSQEPPLDDQVTRNA